MTDDFKNTLFKYVNGTLTSDIPNNKEIIKSVSDINYEDWQPFLPNTGNITINGTIHSKNQLNDLTVVYGGYILDDIAYGLIILLDADYKPVKSFMEYENGTKLRYIQQMNISEDNTFYAIDSANYYPVEEDKTKRLILLNDFTAYYSQIDDYILKLRKSYILPKSCESLDSQYLVKNPNSAHYFIAGQSVTRLHCIALEIKINYAEETTFNVQTETNLGDFELSEFAGAYAEFTGEDKLFFEIAISDSFNHRVGLLIQNYNESHWVSKEIAKFDYESYFINSQYTKQQCVFVNKNELYFICNNMTISGDDPADKYIGFYKYEIETQNLTTIYLENLGVSHNVYGREIRLTTDNNNLYVLFCEHELTTDLPKEVGDVYCFRYSDGWSPVLIKENSNISNPVIMVTSVFNLVQMLIIDSLSQKNWSVLVAKENYNSLNYNGSRYENSNSLIPKDAEIYSNDELVFARNLYNQSLSENVSISTVEIPNSYLNNIDLTSKNLNSKTNVELTKNDNVLNKNIYENLYLNFINAIQVIDNNDNNHVINQNASTYLNNAINTNNMYNLAKICDKVIVFYQDNTTKEIGYHLTKIDDLSANIEFMIYTDKLVNRAEIVSNDKNMTYQVINLSDLEANKYYKISQKLEVI